MHYYAYEFAHSVLSPMRFGVSGVRSMLDWPFNPIANTPYGRHLAAACELFENVTRRYGKPEFGLKTTRVGGVEVGVREQVVASTPFGRLLHFKRDETGLTGKRYDPKVLIVAPMSGHYATLLRGTVKAMLPDHETSTSPTGTTRATSRSPWDASISTTSSITSSSSFACSAPTCTSSASANQPCRCSPPWPTWPRSTTRSSPHP